MREIVSTADAPSSPLYSQAVKAGGLVYVSGLVGVDVITGGLAGPTIREQTRQALANCRAVLRAQARRDVVADDRCVAIGTVVTVDGTSGAVQEETMNPRSALTRIDRRLLLVVVLAIIVAGVVLAAATGHHTAVPHAATAIEYGL
jgi:enamine deaminase RidA (YjgF/YER057c/UK114 family)